MQNVLEMLVSDQHVKSCPALEKPVLLGWFVGQITKTLNGNADPDEMLRKVVAKARKKKS